MARSLLVTRPRPAYRPSGSSDVDADVLLRDGLSTDAVGIVLDLQRHIAHLEAENHYLNESRRLRAEASRPDGILLTTAAR